MEELTKQCPFCGQTINAAAIKCKYCGKWLDGTQTQTPPPPPPPQQPYQQPPQQTYYVEQPRKSNGLGVAGFILAIIGLFLGWIPIVGWVIWFLGLLFSFIGIFKAPRGLAIAGLIISLLGLLVIVGLTGWLTAAFKEGLAGL